MAELASAAAATVVDLLATDAWGQVRNGIVALWRRFKPEQAAAVEAELNAGRTEVLGADAATVRALACYWESRLLRLMAAEADAARELRQVVSALGGRHADVQIRQYGHVTGHGSVIQVAGNAQIGSLRVPRYR